MPQGEGFHSSSSPRGQQDLRILLGSWAAPQALVPPSPNLRRPKGPSRGTCGSWAGAGQLGTQDKAKTTSNMDLLDNCRFFPSKVKPIALFRLFVHSSKFGGQRGRDHHESHKCMGEMYHKPLFTFLGKEKTFIINIPLVK